MTRVSLRVGAALCAGSGLLALLACAPAGAPGGPAGVAAPSASASARAFDGTWHVTFLCPRAPDGAAGYTLRFQATVRDGLFRAERPPQGASGPLVWEGRIQPDGTATLVASGQTGDPDYVLGRLPRGSQLSYRVQARFDGRTGTGTRMTGRDCTASFQRA